MFWGPGTSGPLTKTAMRPVARRLKEAHRRRTRGSWRWIAIAAPAANAVPFEDRMAGLIWRYACRRWRFWQWGSVGDQVPRLERTGGRAGSRVGGSVRR